MDLTNFIQEFEAFMRLGEKIGGKSDTNILRKEIESQKDMLKLLLKTISLRIKDIRQHYDTSEKLRFAKIEETFQEEQDRFRRACSEIERQMKRWKPVVGEITEKVPKEYERTSLVTAENTEITSSIEQGWLVNVLSTTVLFRGVLVASDAFKLQTTDNIINHQDFSSSWSHMTSRAAIS